MSVLELTYIKHTQYGITDVAVAGCLYIANGGGNFIGARISGREILFFTLDMTLIAF